MMEKEDLIGEISKNMIRLTNCDEFVSIKDTDSFILITAC